MTKRTPAIRRLLAAAGIIATGRHSVSIKNKRRFFMVLFTIPVGAETLKMDTSATRCSWVDSPLVTVYLKQQKCHLKWDKKCTVFTDPGNIFADKWGRKLECWPSQLEDSSRSNWYHDGRWEGQPMLPDLVGAAQLWASGYSSCCYTAYSSLGRMPISANVLAFSLIGKTDHIEL
jgi:hypothetical protein